MGVGLVILGSLIAGLALVIVALSWTSVRIALVRRQLESLDLEVRTHALERLAGLGDGGWLVIEEVAFDPTLERTDPSWGKTRWAAFELVWQHEWTERGLPGDPRDVFRVYYFKGGARSRDGMLAAFDRLSGAGSNPRAAPSVTPLAAPPTPTGLADFSRRAWERYENGEYAGAIADFTEAIAIEPEDPWLFVGCAQARAKFSDFVGAIRDYDAAIALDPAWAAHRVAKIYNNRGAAKEASDDLAGAVSDYDAALRVDPEHENALYNRGVAKDRLEDFKGAEADLSSAIHLDSDYLNAFYVRAGVRISLNDFDGAILDYTQVLHLDPRHAVAHAALGSTRAKKGELDAAIESATEALAYDGKLAYAYSVRGRARLRKRDLDYALGDLRMAVRLDPDDAGSHYDLARAQSLMGKISESIASIGRAVELGWLDPEKLELDPDLEKLRADDRYPRLMERLRGASD